MNILILSWRGSGHPQSGGAEQTTLAHMVGWVKAHHNVTLFTSSFVKAQENEIIKGVEIIRRGDQFIGVRVTAFFWYWFGKHSKIDLVVDEFHGIPFFTPVWAFKSKILGFIHEVAQPVWHLNTWPKPFNLIPAIVGKYGEPWMFRLLYQNVPFMTVSESTKKDLEYFGVKKITVVHNGVTLPKKLPRIAKEKVFTVIYLSALAKDKGIEDAVQAFSLVNKEIPNAKFWIVGKGRPDYVSYLQSLCPQAKFWGYISENKKFERLARAHVLLNPSIHEGWGLVNIEANSMGTPVVGYKVAGMKDSVINGETGILVEKGNIGNLAGAIEQIKLRTNWISNCKQWAKNFSWPKSIRKSLKLIDI